MPQKTGNQEEIARAAIQHLVDKYDRQRANYRDSSYKETPLRNDFADPFLEALGWDLGNDKNLPQHRREVLQEETVEDEAGAKRQPDYTLRVGGERRLFLEAKKPSIRIEDLSGPAFQLRRYGWNATLPASVLFNFEHLVIYDCRLRPEESDGARIGRWRLFHYSEYVERFDELKDLLSRDAVYAGRLQAIFEEDEASGTEPFDAFFLHQIEQWRKRLAGSIAGENPKVSEGELSFLTQRLINRIVFLRVCEDRRLEVYERLKSVENYEELKALFQEADRRYNSGLFDLAEDQFARGISVDACVLISIFEELYLPRSPFDFSVVETQVLGKIYEQFLGRRVRLSDGRDVTIEQKPEVAASAGVVPTPPYVADEIVARTLGPLLAKKSPGDLTDFEVCDICCGSGSFLLSAYEFLSNHYREWYLSDGPENHPGKIYEVAQGMWHLSLEEKRRIALQHIYGVDKDAEATEVARLSLLLKVIENETPEAVEAHLEREGEGALPDLRANVKQGNSLLDETYFDFDSDALTDADVYAELQPFEWSDAFPEVMSRGGFDAIIGNPPYVRIQNMVRYIPRETLYFQSGVAPYETVTTQSIDAYFIFIERALSLLKPEGLLGYIVPHKFFTIDAGESLRRLLSAGKHLREITHFGTQQVFPGRETYTAILVLGKHEADSFQFERVQSLQSWRAGQRTQPVKYPIAEYEKEKWGFVNAQAADIFSRVRARANYRLDDVASIFVGLQTSADDVYIFKPTGYTKEQPSKVHVSAEPPRLRLLGTEPTGEASIESVRFENDGQEWEIEPDLLVPCLLDVEVELFEQPEANAFMIFPYRFDESGRAVEIEEDEMHREYPNTLQYLEANEERLRGRSVSGGKHKDVWYRFGRSQSLRRFTGDPKLVWPVLSLRPKYTYDASRTRFTGGGNGPYYALREKPGKSVSLFYLLGLLSHPLLEAMVRARASAFQGDYYSHGKTYVRHLPICVPRATKGHEMAGHQTKIEDAAETLVDLTEKRKAARTNQERDALRRQIDQLRKRMHRWIDELYGVDSDEYKRAIAFDRLFAVGAGEV